MKNQILCLITLLLLGLAACSRDPELPPPTGEAVPDGETTAAADAADAAVTDEVWARVQAAGKIVVGTSADYPPFAYYELGQGIQGYDAALVREIASRLNLDLELKDLAFPSLGGSLQLGQIDVAAAAISVTPERAAEVRFTDAYYVGSDALLARADAELALESPEDLTPYRIAVQDQSVYEDWLRENLIDPGFLDEDNLFLFAEATQAAEALQEGRVDLFMLDQQPARRLAQSAELAIVAEGLHPQRYALAVPPDAERLQSELNQILADLEAEGVLAELAATYLGLEADQVLPVEDVPPVEPLLTAPAACIDGMALVEHLTLDDQNMMAPPEMLPGQPFRKSWRLQNIGTCTWDTNYSLVFTDANVPAAQMGGRLIFVEGTVAPGATYDFHADLISPLVPGAYQAFWTMRNANGILFGERVWVGITVPTQIQPTPLPTQTPSPNVDFSVDRNQITAGECVTFFWNVRNVQAAYFYQQGEQWELNGVPGQGSSVRCPTTTTTYNLRVLTNDGTVQIRQIMVLVEPAKERPQIDEFAVSPSSVNQGQCVNIRWTIIGDVERVRLRRNELTLWDNAPFQGNLQDCPTGSGVQSYFVEAGGPTGETRLQQNVNVFAAPSAFPTPARPTATPGPARPTPVMPSIDLFAVSPTVVSPGQCITLDWRITGDPQTVEIVRNGAIILSPAPIRGPGYDCDLSQPGTYLYRLNARGASGQAVFRESAVTVAEP